MTYKQLTLLDDTVENAALFGGQERTLRVAAF